MVWSDVVRAAGLGCAMLLAVAACDTDGTSGGLDGGNGGPLTKCDYPYDISQPGAGIGERCTADADCATGVCMMPGDNGNVINDAFGFCTRGCDCNDDPASNLSSEEKASFYCMLPEGGNGSYHYVGMRCASVSTCAAFDAGWNKCAITVTGGGSPAVKVCQVQ